MIGGLQRRPGRHFNHRAVPEVSGHGLAAMNLMVPAGYYVRKASGSREPEATPGFENGEWPSQVAQPPRMAGAERCRARSTIRTSAQYDRGHRPSLWKSARWSSCTSASVVGYRVHRGSIAYSSNPSSGMANTVRAFSLRLANPSMITRFTRISSSAIRITHVRKADPVNSSLTNEGAFQRRK